MTRNLNCFILGLLILCIYINIEYRQGYLIKCQDSIRVLGCISFEDYDTSPKPVDTDKRVPENLRKDIDRFRESLEIQKHHHAKKAFQYNKPEPGVDHHMRCHKTFLLTAHHLQALRTHANSYIVGDFRKMDIIKSHLSPLEQFNIKDFLTIYSNIGLNTRFIFTNMSLYLMIISSLTFIVSVIYNILNSLISNLWSLNKESLYATIHGIVVNQIDYIKGQSFLPFIYTIFIFIFVSNLIGMIPYNFSSTSHFILTFFISFTIVVGSTILGSASYKSKFACIFVPSGCPLGLLPLLVLIETISYLARNISLGLRLAANILSGHMLLNILSDFTYNIMASGLRFFIIGILPLAFITAFSTLEMGICFIQAQVFSVLSSSYIKDGISIH